MNLKSIPGNKFKQILFLPLILMMVVQMTTFAQSTELSLVDIFTALRSRKASLPEKNQILSEGVKQRGITFVINKSLEDELRNAGANEDLLNAIREKSPQMETPVKLKVEPTPNPVETPRPPDFNFYNNRANSNFVLGEYETAINDYTKAIELKPSEPTVFLSRGIAFYNTKKFDLAIADFDNAIKLDPTESMAFYNRGNAFEKAGNKQKAMNDYQKAFELNKENDLAENAFKRLQASIVKPKPPEPNKEVFSNPTNTKEVVNNPTATKEETKQVDSNEPLFVDSLQTLAVKLAIPSLSAFESSRNIGGLVTVEIVIDENGKVTSAKAMSGPKFFYKVCETAARRSTFKPYLVDGKPVKITGFINYNFNSN